MVPLDLHRCCLEPVNAPVHGKRDFAAVRLRILRYPGGSLTVITSILIRGRLDRNRSNVTLKQEAILQALKTEEGSRAKECKECGSRSWKRQGTDDPIPDPIQRVLGPANTLTSAQ